MNLRDQHGVHGASDNWTLGRLVGAQFGLEIDLIISCREIWAQRPNHRGSKERPQPAYLSFLRDCSLDFHANVRSAEHQTEHLDFDKRRIFIPSAKAGQREQPMTKALSDFLKAHPEGLPGDAEWLFPNNASQSGRVMTIQKVYWRVIKAAGLNPDEVLRHRFRHTAITHLAQAGVDLPTVQKVSGHKTLAMVARSAHANGEHMDAAMDNLERRIAVPI